MCRRQLLTASAAAFLLASAPSWFPAQAEEKKEPIGVLLAVGDIAECLTDAERKRLKSKDKKTRERAEAHAKNKSGAATAELVRLQITKTKEKHPKAGIRVLALGDLAYDCGATSAFKCFHETWGQFEADKILLPVPGNHEYEHKKREPPADMCVTEELEKTKERYHAKPFFKYFEKNNFAKTEQGFNTLRFPDEKNGPWLLVGLNPYAKLSSDELKKALDKQTDIRCIIAFSHPPLYSSGYHGHKNKKKKDTPLAASETIMRAPFQALYEARVSALVAGHDHHYEQLGRAKHGGLNTDKGESVVDPDRGVRSFIVGTGGTNLYSFDYDHFWKFREAYNIGGYGILKIMLYQDSYAWEFLPTKDNKGPLKTIEGIKFKDNCNR